MLPQNSFLFHFFLLILCLILITLTNNVSLGDDTISENRPLSGDQTIVSSGGVFVLGFFSPGNSSNHYIGMWYKKVAERTVVWVANRDKPVLDRFSSELTISCGNLVLFDESKSPIWTTNVNSTSVQSVQAVLLDNGNLVLKGRSNVSTLSLWESFDHPADTWLPGAKLGYNNRTKKKQMLISWKNKEDPAPGLFSLELVPEDSSYIIRWNQTKSYWSSGSWDGHIFSWVPEMRLNYIYNFSFVSNSNETYFTYSVYVSANMLSKFALDASGLIKQQNYMPTNEWNLFWSQPRQQCQVHAFCGEFSTCNEKSLPFCVCLKGFEPKSKREWQMGDYSGGCSRRKKLGCGGRRDRFEEMSNVLLASESNKESIPAASDSSACESACLNNCSCVAYYFGDEDGCSVWNGDLLNLQKLEESDSRGKTLYVRLSASEFPNPKRKKWLAIAFGSASLLAILLVLILFFIFRRQEKIAAATTTEGSLTVFGYRELQSATKNFSEKLGQGGFGSVFKGVLPDSSLIAVKKLESGVGQGEKQFRTEVGTIGKIQHLNLVRLRGFCSQGTQRLLVYDYMTNGSLDSHIFAENRSSTSLPWDTRYRIALGTARGLVYLHENCRECIIHCDVKPENILLDEEFCPKVADFGLAKLVGREFSRVLTTMRGTRGYLAPEWIAGMAVTPKADVYSFGMTLFEVVSGRRNAEHCRDGKVNFFPMTVSTELAKGGSVIRYLDPSLEAIGEEVERVLKVACWCIQDDESLRPSMSQVVQMLEGIGADVNRPPVPRSLHFYAENNDEIVFFTESSSNNNAS